ncbi:MAG: 30S ribosomal protein S12 methylthiotransferase RimO, partial [Actinobacteria bacterium]|nr:30S ribosomal protein S12 methylthiotransferase RimO [Actinomycetota bacterium]
MTASFHIITLGCPKNRVDSEHISQLLADAGYASVPAPDDADVVIVNTCGFIEAAKQESIDAILSLGLRKARGQVLIAAGCLSERYGPELLKEVAELDAALGTLRWGEVASLVEGAVRGQRLCWTGEPAIQATVPRRAAAPTAYLKIAEGCSAGCAFCAIPAIKGPQRSKPLEQCVAEARSLAAQGVQELVLIAQDTTAYASDLGRREGLSELIEAILDEAPALPWLRLMYAYPQRVSPRLIETMARSPQVVKYLDLPLQHAHPDTLRRMRRPFQGAAELVAGLRAAMLDIALRTTFIVGYPGETEAEFQALLEFMEETAFDWVGVFTYSPEEGTHAATLPGQVPARVKRQRYNRAMRLQQAITRRRQQAQVGRVLPVLVEGLAQDAATGLKKRAQAEMAHASLAGASCVAAVGRSYREGPEVDGLVLLDRAVAPGKIVQARVSAALTYDLMA